MKNTLQTPRSEELRAALEAAQRDLSTAREALGSSIADGNDDAASEHRAEVARLERLVAELEPARSIALRREREAAAKERARQQAEREREANKNRKARIAAAKRVDSAMAALGRAYEELLALDTGGDLERKNAAHVTRRKRYSARGAFAFHAPTLSLVLEVPVIPAAHRRPLAESESGLITEFPE